MDRLWRTAAAGRFLLQTGFCRSTFFYGRDSSSLRFAHSSRSSLRVAYTGSYSSASPPQTRSLSALVGIVVARRPKGLPSTLFLLRKTVPFSRPRRQSQFCPPAAVAYLPQNDSCSVILSEAKDPGRQPEHILLRTGFFVLMASE